MGHCAADVTVGASLRRGGYWLIAAWAACLASVCAQPGSGPYAGYAYPAGGRQGATVRVIVGGQLLSGTRDVYVSGTGVRGRVVQYVRPLNQNELNDVGWYLRELVRRRWNAQVMDAERKANPPHVLPDHPWLRDLNEKTPAELARLRRLLFDTRKQPNAQLADQVQIDLTVAPDAPLGERQLRLLTPAGLTNPVCFQVGVVPEVTEQDRDRGGGADAAPLALPVVLNGQIMPGEVDRFCFRARAGAQLVARAQARHLMPYLADAVPGWFQAAMTLRDVQGHELAHADCYRFDPDPVLFCKIPSDGLYQLEVYDAIYRGRDDFVYRVTVGELPFITQIFPLGGRAGKATSATVLGWNLPVGTVPLDTQPGPDRIRYVRLPQCPLCNEWPYAVDALPEVVESEPNGTAAEAQQVTLPLVIDGRIGRSGDVDVFRFAGRAGEDFVAEVMARRLGSPLDSLLRLEDATGKVLASNDDTDDPCYGLLTHHADSYLRVKLPQDGEYRVILSDAQNQGDACAYRLRLGPAQPDFAVLITPSGASLPGGRAATLAARVVRKDGFDGPVDIVLKDPPAGFTVSGGRVPAGKDTANLTLSAPRGLSPQTLLLHFEARAQIGAATVAHPVTPAEDMMQAFAYRHLVPQPEFVVIIPGAREVPAVWRPLAAGFEPVGAAALKIPQGGTAPLRINLPAALAAGRQALSCKLAAGPRGVTLREVAITPATVTCTLKADGIIANEGDTGNVIIEVFTAAGRPEGTEPTSLGVLPAMPVQVVRP